MNMNLDVIRVICNIPYYDLKIFVMLKSNSVFFARHYE